MKILCLVLTLLLAYASAAYCAGEDRSKSSSVDALRPWPKELDLGPEERKKAVEKMNKHYEALELRWEPSKTAEERPNKHSAEEKRNQEEAQRIQAAVDEQLSTNMKERLNYTEQIVNNLIY